MQAGATTIPHIVAQIAHRHRQAETPNRQPRSIKEQMIGDRGGTARQLCHDYIDANPDNFWDIQNNFTSFSEI